MNTKTKKVVILTEGGEQIGFGHITRCLSLSRAFERAGWQTEFYVHGDQTVASILPEQVYALLDWSQVINTEQPPFFLKDAAIVIVDSYLANDSVYEEISRQVKVPVYLDDTLRLDYPPGIVVNWSITAAELPYPKRKDVSYLLGPTYISLREPFWQVSEQPVSPTVKSVLLSFGGDDSKNMTPPVLDFLVCHYPELTKLVVIGNAFKNITEIQSVKDHHTRIIFSPDGHGMKQVMQQSDIAIVSGGQTLYELARIGVPAVVVAVADNQRHNVQGWEKTGFIENAGFWTDIPLMANLAQKFRELSAYERRLRATTSGHNLVSGLGVDKIVAFCQNMAA